MAEQTTTVVAGNFGGRPKPPEELTERQGEIWNRIVTTEPPDFFSTAALRGLLADYCRHRESAERISGVIDSFKSEWLKSEEGAKRYEHLLKMRERETRAVRSYATKLRLTNQARYTPQAAGTAGRHAGRAARPWED